MQATNCPLLQFIGATNTQYYIPVFQRNYSWTGDECLQLLNDIIKIANDHVRPCHFIGSIIHLPTTSFATQRKCALIDGQQRLTTISLLFLALAYYSREFYNDEQSYNRANTNLNQIKQYYLINAFGEEDFQYRIKLSADDFIAYRQLINDGDVSKDLRESNIFLNYQKLLNELRRIKLDPSIIMTGISKLLIVEISLNPEDNAQLIFDTVNSTGQDLTVTQRIKNYILMTVPPEQQEQLYTNYWQPMERSLSDELDVFIRYYLIVKEERNVKEEYYAEFKAFVTNSHSSTESVVKEIYRYYCYYEVIRNARTDSNDKVVAAIARIKQTKQDKVLPVVLRVMSDIETNLCTKDQATDVFSVIEAYWMRRKICCLPTNTAGNVSLVMLRSLGNDESYVQSFISAILNVTPAQRMPTDSEIKQQLRTIPFYEKEYARSVLDLIEAHENRDYNHLATHSIEHIMPQTIQSHDDLFSRDDLSDEQKEKTDWASDLGDNWETVYRTYVHSIGNLTLTGYNSEYQNYRFYYKKTMENGYNDSPIRITRNLVATKDKWGEEEIIERSDKLAMIIADIWKYPSNL